MLIILAADKRLDLTIISSLHCIKIVAAVHTTITVINHPTSFIVVHCFIIGPTIAVDIAIAIDFVGCCQNSH